MNRAVAADAHYRSWFEQRFVEDGIGHVPQDPGQAAQRYEHVRGALYAALGSPVIAGGGCQASARYPRQGSAP